MSCSQDGPKSLRAILKQQPNGLKQQLNGFQATAEGGLVSGQPRSGTSLPVLCSAGALHFIFDALACSTQFNWEYLDVPMFAPLLSSS